MEIILKVDDLRDALNKCSGIIDTNTMTPVLAGVLIYTKDNNVFLRTSNGIKNIVVRKKANVLKQGKVLLPAKLLNNIAKRLPADNDVSFDYDKENGSFCEVCCKKIKYNLKGLNDFEFPEALKPGTQLGAKLDFSVFKEWVSKAINFVAKEELRPAISGLHIGYEQGENIAVEATDAYRIFTQDFTNGETRNFICDTEMANLICKNHSVGEMQLYFDNLVFVIVEDTMYYFPEISGNFPDIKPLLTPKDGSILLHFEDKKRLLQILKRCKLIDEQVTFEFTYITNHVNISAKSDIGETGDCIKYDRQSDIGDDKVLEITFNTQYIIDMLDNLSGNTFNLFTPDSPTGMAIFKGEMEETGIVLPISKKN